MCHPPYLPDLPPPPRPTVKLKSDLKGLRFAVISAIRQYITILLNAIPENEFQDFQQWYIVS